MMASTSVAYPDRTARVVRLPLPEVTGDSGLLRVAASGVCGTDVSLFGRGMVAPCILGHHVVGEIAAVGDAAAARWHVDVGSRVVLEEYLPCQRCYLCERGDYRLCPATDLWAAGKRVGLVPVDEDPGLWGGNAEYLYLPDNIVMHPVPEGVGAALAVWALPLANAVDWVIRLGRAAPGDIVVIFGPGQHGLCSVVAARHAGAQQVIVCGKAEDRERLEVAQALGADHVVEVDRDHPVDSIRRLTGGRMADVAVECAGSQAAVHTALKVTGRDGRVVFSGTGEGEIVLEFSALVRGPMGVTGARGRRPESVRTAISLLATNCGLEAVPTLEVSLDEVGDVLTRLARDAGFRPPHVVVAPCGPARWP